MRKPTEPKYKSASSDSAHARVGDGRYPPASIAALFADFSRTKVNGRLGLLCDVAVSVALISMAMRGYGVAQLTSVAVVVSGLALFSFIEYGFHRWIFHGGVAALERGHWQHHLFPLGDDSLPFFAPPLVAIVLAYALAAIVPTGVALLFVGGMAAGYALYGLSHVAIHNVYFVHAMPRRWAAAHHIHHHHPNKNFGVTTPLWDIVLGTRYVSRRSQPASRSDGSQQLS